MLIAGLVPVVLVCHWLGLPEWAIWVGCTPVVLLSSWIDREGFWGIPIDGWPPQKDFQVEMTLLQSVADPLQEGDVVQALLAAAPHSHPTVTSDPDENVLRVRLSCTAGDAESAAAKATTTFRRAIDDVDRTRVIALHSAMPQAA